MCISGSLIDLQTWGLKSNNKMATKEFEKLKPLPTLKPIPDHKRVIISSTITKNPVVLLTPPPPPPLMRIIHSPDKKDPSRLERSDEKEEEIMRTKFRRKTRSCPLSPVKKVVQEIFSHPKKFRTASQRHRDARKSMRERSSRIKPLKIKFHSFKRAVRTCRKPAEFNNDAEKCRQSLSAKDKEEDDDENSDDTKSSSKGKDDTDVDSKKSEDSSNEITENTWKPMARRAAATAALELVAKSAGKAPDLENRRMRKPYSRFCTRGKGRRTLVFKRKAKV